MPARKFRRSTGERRYHKLFVIAVEGEKTEPQYFTIFKLQQPIICIKCLKSNKKTSARQVLQKMQHYINEQRLRNGDEAWLVVDKDRNTDSDLAELFNWSKEKDSYGFALSHPSFEYWLLLHFEDGNHIVSSRDCIDRLKQHLPGYNKGIDPGKFSYEKIKEAIRRAKLRDNPPCADWPREPGCTTVYRLVENILKFR